MMHPFALFFSLMLLGLGFSLAMLARNPESRQFARACLLSGLVIGVLAFVGCASSNTGRGLNIGVIAAAGLDVHSSPRQGAVGMREGNRLMGDGLLQQTLLKSLGVSTVIAGAAILTNKQHPIWAHVVRSVVMVAWVGASVHNYQLRK